MKKLTEIEVIMYKKILILMLFGLILCSCTKSNNTDNTVTNSIPLSNEKEKYIAKEIDFPYDKNTLELDYIAEKSVAMLTNPSGDMEWITVSRGVKTKYKNIALKTIQQRKQLRPEWLECKVWKFSLSDDGSWVRESVGKKAVTSEKRDITGFKSFYHNDILYFVVICENKDDEMKSVYSLSLFELDNNKWKRLNSFKYSGKDKDVVDPVNCFIDSSGFFDVAKINGEIAKFDVSSGKMKDQSTDFKFDLLNAMFDENLGYSEDGDKNEVLVYNLDSLIEEKRIKIPEKSENGTQIMGLDGEKNLYILNKKGIYYASEEDEVFKRISDIMSVDGIALDDMVLMDMFVENKDNIYVYMYDSSSEEMKDHILQVKKVGE